MIEQFREVSNLRYTLEIDDFKGKDYTRNCFLFPGQGISSQGLYQEELNHVEEFKDQFYLLEKICERYDLISPKCLSLEAEKIPKEQLQVIKLIWLLGCCISMGKLLENWGIRPDFITGTSFGEFPGLVLSGILSIEDAVDFIIARERIAKEIAHPSRLIAVFSNKETIQESLQTLDYEISIINTPKQIVIGAYKENISKIKNKLFNDKIFHQELTEVPYAYHTRYMDNVSKSLKNYIEMKGYHYQECRINFLSSSLMKLFNRGKVDTDQVNEVLFSQVLNTVNFNGQIEEINKKWGIHNFIELSPKRVLRPFINDILYDSSINIFSFAEITGHGRKRKVAKNTKEFDLNKVRILKKIIKGITGYDFDKISLEDRFQEDLGIDSIKKAGILFKFMEETNTSSNQNLNLSQINNLYDAVSVSGDLSKENPVHDFYPHIKKLENIQSTKPLVTKTYDSIIELHLGEEPYFSGKDNCLIILLNKDFAPTKFLKTIEWVKKNLKNKDIILVNDLNQNDYGLCALFKSLKKERYIGRFKSIKIDKEYDYYKKIIRDNGNNFGDIEVVYKDFNLYKPAWVPSTENNIPFKISCLLSIGGSTGIGYSVLKSFPNAREIQLTLIGRRAEKDIQENLVLLKKIFREVLYIEKDIKEFCREETRGKRYDLVINTIGLIDGNKFESFDSLRALKVYNSKLSAYDIINQTITAKKIIHFSSIAAFFGMENEAIYSMSNSALEQLCSQSNKNYYIAWPAWYKIGMTKDPLIFHTLKNRGFSFLEEKRGAELFYSILNQEENIFISHQQELDHQLSQLKDRYHLDLLFKNPEILNDRGVRVRVLCSEKLFGHRINNKTVFPAGGYISLLLSFLNKTHGKFTNFDINAPLFVSTEELDFYIEEDLKNIKISSASSYAKTSFEFSNNLPKVDLMRKGGKTLLKDSIYRDYKLFYQNGFQILDEVILSKNYAFARITIDKLDDLFFKETIYSKLTLLLDSVFQLIMILSYAETKKPIPLPTKIKDIWFDLRELDTKQMFVEVVTDDSSSEGMLSEAVIVNEQNKMVFKLNGILSKYID